MGLQGCPVVLALLLSLAPLSRVTPSTHIPWSSGESLLTASPEAAGLESPGEGLPPEELREPVSYGNPAGGSQRCQVSPSSPSCLPHPALAKPSQVLKESID